MQKHSMLAVTVLVLLSIGFARPAFAVKPEVRNVIVQNVNGKVVLQVTIYHTEETPSHYVDRVDVSFGSNTTDLQLVPQSLGPDQTFNITYDVGPVSGNPTATVSAECNLHGWSETIHTWTGQIPEYQVPMLLLALVLASSIGILAARRRSRLF